MNASIFFKGRRRPIHPDFFSMEAAPKKVSVSAILLGIVGGIIGLAAGLFLGFALGAILARVLHISSFEGGAGYFAVAIALLVTVLVMPVAILLTFTGEEYAGFGSLSDW